MNTSCPTFRDRQEQSRAFERLAAIGAAAALIPARAATRVDPAVSLRCE